MKVKVIATGNAPTHYSFSGDTVTAHYNTKSETYDLSPLGSDDKFEGITVDTLELSSGHIIRDAYRDESGELFLTLCQCVGPGHWQESEFFDVSQYKQTDINVNYNRLKDHSGKPWVMTSEGKQWVK